MTEIALDLESRVNSALPLLRAFSDAEVARSRGAGKWTKKEILGHLIDSASNNDQRFLRAQFANPFIGPGYDQDKWVSIHAYGQRPWPELVDLWAALNRQVSCVMRSVPAEKLTTQCIIGDGAPVTLEWLMRDYVKHLLHHLEQILPA